jgi:CSLREA domain-containing protein
MALQETGMKKLRLALAGMLALGAGVQAALINTINVTTLLDEDGNNPAACSLREAVKAVNTNAPYGGCAAGHPTYDNLIQLEAAEYPLTLGEITVTAEVAIVGKDRDAEAHADAIEPLTGKKPLHVRPDYDLDPLVDPNPDLGRVGTTITADASSRIFRGLSSLTLRDVELKGSDSGGSGTAVDGNGGVIYAQGPLFLTNVIIRDGRVIDSLGSGAGAGNGGAIYMAGDGSGLTMTDVTLESNVAANTGGGIAMLCEINLNPYALHSLNIKRSLFKHNSATVGAGAIDICGNTGATIDTTTFAGNVSFFSNLAVRPDSAAISFVHEGNPGLGLLTLTHVTAAEQTGHVLALKGIGAATVSGSLLAFSTAGTICFNPDLDPDIDTPSDVDAPMMTALPAGTYNAVSQDGSCEALLMRTPVDTNKDIPLGTPMNQVLAALTTGQPFTAGGPYGLTEYYLPIESGTPPTYVIDQGGSFDNCSDEDQRNVSRKSGAFCDIGAVERLKISASNDEDQNTKSTDRKATIDVLDNDTFGEAVGGPYQFPVFAPNRPVELINDADGRCKWQLETLSDGTTAGRVVVSSPNGELRDKTDPIICTYRVHNNVGDFSDPAEISVVISNVAPRARDDLYIRPVGTTEISFDPLANDDDSGDGKYGNEPEPEIAPETEPDGDPRDCEEVTPAAPAPFNHECQYTSRPNWIDLYPPIEITVQPQLGEIRGARADACPGRVTSTCLTPPLRYIAKNSFSPFSDTFTYRVYDQDEMASNAAVVTIKTDAPDIDHGGTGGSIDLLGGLILSLLGLRRLRRL